MGVGMVLMPKIHNKKDQKNGKSKENNSPGRVGVNP